MSLLNKLGRLSNYYIHSYNPVHLGVNNHFNQIQIFNYTSIETKLGIDKPKRPPNSFLRFKKLIEPNLKSKNSHLTVKEIAVLASEKWKEIDNKMKEQLNQDYAKDKEAYAKKIEEYKSSLTEEQIQAIKKMKEKRLVSKKKRELKAFYKEHGRPKRPMSAYLLFVLSKKEQPTKEFHEQMKQQWSNLPDTEKERYRQQSQELWNKYKEDMEAWNLKMEKLQIK